ncbi:MAG: hypothetical protein J6M12_03575 [Clostridia bacterium]|nr:hypothetical protein [Clostridia bacterium]
MMKKRMLSLLMAMVVLLLPLLLAACNDPNYMGTMPPMGAPSGEEGGERLSEQDPQIPDLTPPVDDPTEDDPTEDEPTMVPDVGPSPSREPVIEPTSSESTPEPEEKYSTRWLEWLVNEDNGASYCKAYNGGLYAGVCFEDGMEPSSWEVWPLTDGQFNKDSRFHLLPYLSSAEFDGYSNLGTEEYEYTWKVFYREAHSFTAEYKSVDAQPWSGIEFGPNYLYRLNLHDYGRVDMHLKEDGSANLYHVIMVIVDKQDEVVIWRDEFVSWTESSEAFYNKSLEMGVIKGGQSVQPDDGKNDHGETEPEKYTTEWLEWLINDYGDVYSMCWGGGLYNGIRYKDNMEPSSFELWPYYNGEVTENSRFFFCPVMSAAEFDGYTNLGTEEYEYTWKVFYRESDGEGEYGMVEMTPWNAILFGDNYLYRLNIHDYGQVDMHLKEDGSANTYHVIMVIVDKQDEVVIWRDEFVDWTDSSEAFYQDALRLGVIGRK